MNAIKSALSNRLLKQATAEFVGTLILALTVEVVVFGTANYAASFQGLYAPFVVGLAVAVLVAVLGGISGGNFNPSVSVALFAIRKLSLAQLAAYLAAQAAGAYAGFHLAKLLLGATEPLAYQATSYAWWGEAAGAFLLVIAVTAVVLGRIGTAAAGPIIGAALALGITVSSLSSGGVLNPAVAWAFGIRALPYFLAPLLGGIAAACLYCWLAGSAKKGAA